MMADQLARQEQIARRLEQSRRLLQGVTHDTTAKRIGNLIDDLERVGRNMSGGPDICRSRGGTQT